MQTATSPARAGPEKVTRAMEMRMAADGNPRGRWFRALVKTVFEPDPAGNGTGPASSEMGRFVTAMLAASANNPDLLEIPRQTIRRTRDRLLARGTQRFTAARSLACHLRVAPLAAPGCDLTR